VIFGSNRMSRFSGIKNTMREQFHAVIHEEPSQSKTRRFRRLDSSVPLMQPAQIRRRNNVSEPLDRRLQGASFPSKTCVRTSYNK
jgi:hypothetical protein